MQKRKSWPWYILYAAVLIFFTLYIGFKLDYFKMQDARTFQALPYLILSCTSFVGLGLLVGLEKLIYEQKKSGRWKIHIPRILILCIPALYFSIGPYLLLFIYHYDFYFLLNPTADASRMNLTPLFQVFLGYSFITSFYKKQEVLLFH